MSLFPKFNKMKANTVKGAPTKSPTPTPTPPPAGVSGTLTVNAGALGNGNMAISNSGYYSMGTAMFSPGYHPYDDVAKNYFRLFIHKKFEDRSEEFRNKLLDLFTWKIFEEIHKSMIDTFSDDGVEFLKEMSDEEILNYLKITE